jgi:hypothetical protein
MERRLWPGRVSNNPFQFGEFFMRRPRLISIGSLLVAALSIATTTGKPASPSWDVTFAPYIGKALDTMPVQVLVFDVTDHEHGMWVREWRLMNRSDKTIVKIRPALFVAKEDDLDSLLLVRQLRNYYGVTLTPGVQWPEGPCSPQAKSCRNAFATVSLDELMKPLSQQTNTKYRVALGVDKVWFQDGTTWEFNTVQK